MEEEYAFTYEIDHESFSHPIMLDSHFERSDRSVKMWAAVWLEHNKPDLGWDWIEEMDNMQIQEFPADAEQ